MYSLFLFLFCLYHYIWYIFEKWQQNKHWVMQRYWKLCHNFNLRNKKKSHWAKSGEYGGWSMVFIGVMALNSVNAMMHYHHAKSRNCSSTFLAFFDGFPHINSSKRPNSIPCWLFVLSKWIHDAPNNEYQRKRWA